MSSSVSLVFIRLFFAGQGRAYWQVAGDKDGRQLHRIGIIAGDSITRSIFPIPSRAETEFLKE